MEPRWHQWSEEHIAHRGITWTDVEEACTPPTVAGPGKRPGTIEQLGQTNAGTYLVVVMRPDDDGVLGFVVTARVMTDTERRRFLRRRAKG